MTTRGRLCGAKRGALAGLAVGVAVAVTGEAAAAIIRSAADMGDVGIAGFTAVYGIPGSALLGSLLGWWGRPQDTRLLALIAAIPAGLIGIWQVTLQAVVV